MTRERIDWTAIGKEMDRVPQDCRNKWRYVKPSSTGAAPRTQGEDGASDGESASSSGRGSDSSSEQSSDDESDAESVRNSVGGDGDGEAEGSAPGALAKNTPWSPEEVKRWISFVLLL